MISRASGIDWRASGNCIAPLAVPWFIVLVGVQSADRLVYGVQDERPILSEQMAVDVLGGFDLAVSHLMGHLHVGSAGGDEQRGTYVPQLMGGVAGDPIGVGSGITVGELE